MGAARLSHDARVLLLALVAGRPGAAAALWLVWTGSFAPKVEWTVTAAVLASWLGLSLAVRGQVVRALHTLSNLLSALREGDFSIRGRHAGGGDALGAALSEINAPGETLRAQRLGAVEATALLRTSSRSPARLTSWSRRLPSKASTETSISSITPRTACSAAAPSSAGARSATTDTLTSWWSCSTSGAPCARRSAWCGGG